MFWKLAQFKSGHSNKNNSQTAIHNFQLYREFSNVKWNTGYFHISKPLLALPWVSHLPVECVFFTSIHDISFCVKSFLFYFFNIFLGLPLLLLFIILVSHTVFANPRLKWSYHLNCWFFTLLLKLPTFYFFLISSFLILFILITSMERPALLNICDFKMCYVHSMFIL